MELASEKENESNEEREEKEEAWEQFAPPPPTSSLFLADRSLCSSSNPN